MRLWSASEWRSSRVAPREKAASRAEIRAASRPSEMLGTPSRPSSSSWLEQRNHNPRVGVRVPPPASPESPAQAGSVWAGALKGPGGPQGPGAGGGGEQRVGGTRGPPRPQPGTKAAGGAGGRGPGGGDDPLRPPRVRRARPGRGGPAHAPPTSPGAGRQRRTDVSINLACLAAPGGRRAAGGGRAAGTTRGPAGPRRPGQREAPGRGPGTPQRVARPRAGDAPGGARGPPPKAPPTGPAADRARRIKRHRRPDPWLGAGCFTSASSAAPQQAPSPLPRTGLPRSHRSSAAGDSLIQARQPHNEYGSLGRNSSPGRRLATTLPF